MNTPRLIVLGLAAVAAGGAAFLARGLLGGGTSGAEASRAPAPVATSDVLVASTALVPGQTLTADDVRWQKWPTSAVDPSFMTEASTPNLQATIKGVVVRSPLVAGEPITDAKVVRTDATGFMAATLTPGMRAVSIPVSVASVAGGFILPNDRIDLMLTTQISDSPRRFRASILLHDVRVLAIDQASSNEKNPDKNQKPVSDVRTATLELSPQQAELVARSQATGTLSLALRPLVDKTASGRDRVTAARAKYAAETSDTGEISVIRYGVVRPATAASGGQ